MQPISNSRQLGNARHRNRTMPAEEARNRRDLWGLSPGIYREKS